RLIVDVQEEDRDRRSEHDRARRHRRRETARLHGTGRQERQLYWRRPMSRLLVRRSLTAVGIYASVVVGFLATVVAGRILTKQEFGDYATVLYATAFFQAFFDLTVEEALVKYGFRFVTREEWGLLRALFRSAFRFKVIGSSIGGLALLVLAAFVPARMT